MEIKKINIGIKSEEQLFKNFAATFKKAQLGEKIEKKKGIFFENISALRAFITPKRIELIRVIHHQKPESAYKLAKLVERDIKSVMTDLTILESLGLLELRREEKDREKVRPFVGYDSLQVEIAV